MREKGLEELKARFEGWRRGGKKKGRIPAGLIKAAKGLVGRYAPGTLAKALRLHYRLLVPTTASASMTTARGVAQRVRAGSEGVVPRFVRLPMAAGGAGTPPTGGREECRAPDMTH
jgi:hypothetical protein